MDPHASPASLTAPSAVAAGAASPTASAAPERRFVSSLSRTREASRFMRLLGWLSSVRMAAVMIIALGTVIGTATWYERDYGRQVAATMIYTSWWFRGLFALLALNIFGAAAVRYPWKRHQYGFVVVHLGLLTLLAGGWLSRDRLDGMLIVEPGKTASAIELPRDRLSVEGGGEVVFDARRFAGYPSLARHLLSLAHLAPKVQPVIHALAEPCTLIDGGPDGTTVRLLRVLDTGHDELGFLASADGQPAVKLELTARPPIGVEIPIGAKWLDLSKHDEQPFDTIPILPVHASLGRTTNAEAFADFLAPPPIAASAGELAVYWHGQRMRSALTPDALPQTIDLADDLQLKIDLVVQRPRFVDNQLTDDPSSAFDPLVRVHVGTGPVATRTWQTVPVFARRPCYARSDDDAAPGTELPTIVFEHPECYAPHAGEQGLEIEALIGPGGRLGLRWIRASKGFVASTAFSDAWSGAVVGEGDGSPMRLTVAATYLRSAQPGPESRPMRPEAEDRARRWLEVEVLRAGGSARTWIRAYDRETVHLPAGPVTITYQPDQYDLRHHHGFSLELDRFVEGKDPGGLGIASYASEVAVVRDGGAHDPRVIDMNHPLRLGGVTLYQTSFEPLRDAAEQAIPGAYSASIFTAATDPGWPLTYLGAALLVGGILLMYVGPWGLIVSLALDAMLTLFLVVLHY